MPQRAEEKVYEGPVIKLAEPIIMGAEKLLPGATSVLRAWCLTPRDRSPHHLPLLSKPIDQEKRAASLGPSGSFGRTFRAMQACQPRPTACHTSRSPDPDQAVTFAACQRTCRTALRLACFSPQKGLRCPPLLGEHGTQAALRPPWSCPWLALLTQMSKGSIRLRINKVWNRFLVVQIIFSNELENVQLSEERRLNAKAPVSPCVVWPGREG